MRQTPTRGCSPLPVCTSTWKRARGFCTDVPADYCSIPSAVLLDPSPSLPVSPCPTLPDPLPHSFSLSEPLPLRFSLSSFFLPLALSFYFDPYVPPSPSNSLLLPDPPSLRFSLSVVLSFSLALIIFLSTSLSPIFSYSLDFLLFDFLSPSVCSTSRS